MSGLDWAEAAARAEDGQPHPSPGGVGSVPPWAVWGQPDPDLADHLDSPDSDLLLDPTDDTITEPATYDNAQRTVGVDRIDLGGERL